MHVTTQSQGSEPSAAQGRGDDLSERRDANRAIAVSAIGLGVTGFIELAIAVLSGSVGLLGDALHNLSDVSTSLAVFVGLRVSKRRPSETHPYGWERAEDLAGLAVALVIWASAALTAVISVRKLLENGTTSHIGFGIAAAAVGIIGNQVVARYKLTVGKRIRSAALVADARHSWLDALSSAGALLGLVGVALGLPWADGVAGLVMTLFVCHVGWEVTRDIVRHLTDGVEDGVLTAAGDAAMHVEGVEHAHVRARWMGRSLLVEVEGYLRADTTLERSGAIGAEVEKAVATAVPDARFVLWSARAMPA